MAGEPEDIRTSSDGHVLLVNRGKKGAAVINISKCASSVNLPTTLPDGRYTDNVYGKEFKVKKGMLHGYLAPERSYILHKAK